MFSVVNILTEWSLQYLLILRAYIIEYGYMIEYKIHPMQLFLLQFHSCDKETVVVGVVVM